jgi:hypothetical protein
MKVAEALTKIKDIKGKIISLQQTLLSDASFQVIEEGQEVPNIETELQELTMVMRELQDLKTKIYVANVKNNLINKIHEMEQLKITIKTLEPLSKMKQETKMRDNYATVPNIIHTMATFNVESMKSVLDNHRRRLRELDLELQQLNWTVDI